MGGALTALVLLAQAGLAQSSLNIGYTPGYPGNIVTVPLTARRMTNFTAVQFDVKYDPAKASVSGPVGTTAFSNHIVISRPVAPGVRRVIAYSLGNKSLTYTNSRVLANLNVVVPTTERTSSGSISFSNAMAVKPDASLLSPVAFNAGAVFVQPVNLLPDGSAQFFLAATPDQRYLIQATTNFVNWVNLSTNTATGNFMDLVDADAAMYPYRFYRAVPFVEPQWKLNFLGRTAGGVVSLEVSGEAGQRFIVQISNDLKNWSNLATYTLTLNPLTITDPTAAGVPIRFYRLLPISSAGGALSSVQMSSGGQLTFSYPTTAGRTYVLQNSTNLTTWGEILTNVAAGSSLSYTNLISPLVPKQFFRVMELP